VKREARRGDGRNKPDSGHRIAAAEAQKQVSDFVASLKTRYPAAQAARKAKRTKLADEPFIGMWRDREEMKDSRAWVRRLRESEWERLDQE